MTVTSLTNRVLYNGNGATVSFPYPFRIFEASDLVVTQIAASGAITVLVLNVHYTVLGANTPAGGSVVLGTAVPIGEQLAIIRNIPIQQPTAFGDQGRFFAKPHEDAFDRLTAIAQQLAAGLTEVSTFVGVTPPGPIISDIDIEAAPYGADGTGVIESSDAIIAAHAQAVASGARLISQADRIFKVKHDAVVNLRGLAAMDIRGDIVIDGTPTAPVVLIGGDSGDLSFKRLYIHAVRKADSTLPTVPQVRIVGTKNAEITIGECAYVQLYADAGVAADVASAYNQLLLGRTTTLEYANLSGISWLNEWRIRGHVKNILYIDTLGGTYKHNGNVTDVVSEGGTISLANAHSNVFPNGRYEDALGILLGEGCHNNAFPVLYCPTPLSVAQDPTVPFTDPSGQNFLFHAAHLYVDRVPLVEYGPENITLNGFGDVRGVRNLVGGLKQMSAAGFATIWESIYIPFRRGDKFQVHTPDAVWRLSVQLFRADKTLITSVGDPGAMAVTGTDWNDGQNAYKPTSNAGNMASGGPRGILAVDDLAGEVAFFKITLQTGDGTNLPITRFAVHFLQHIGQPWGREQAARLRMRLEMPCVAATPTTGWVRRAGPLIGKTGGGYVQPTTVNDTTLSIAALGGDTAVTVATIGSIASGDQIGVLLDDNTTHWTTVSGAPTGSSVPLTVALVGPAAVGQQVVTTKWVAGP